MARPLKPLVRGGGYYPSRKWIPLVYPGGYTTMNGGEQPEPPTPVYWKTITGISPLALANALAEHIRSLTQYGKCTQASTPTPSAPVDIVCNNGAIKFGWHDIITTSQLSGYGTYVSPSGTAGNRAYKWYKDLPNGTYTFSVDGDYELIVQWRDPADPSVLVPSGYENLSGWMTSGEVVLDKEGGGYGIAVRRTSGTSSITPSNFGGTLHVQERGLYLNGTPETLRVSNNVWAVKDTGYLNSSGDVVALSNYGTTDYIPVTPGQTVTVSETIISDYQGNGIRICFYTSGKSFISPRLGGNAAAVGDYSFTEIVPENAAYLRVSSGADSTKVTDICVATKMQTASVPMLLSVGDIKDEVEIISGLLTHKVGVYVFTGDETFGTSTAYGKCILWNKQNHRLGADPAVAPLCTHYSGLVSPSGVQAENTCFFNSTGHFYFRVADNDTTAFKADLAADYASGNPVILLYALATETTEQTTPHELRSYAGDTTVSWTAAVSGTEKRIEYAQGETASNTVGTAKVGTAKAA